MNSSQNVADRDDQVQELNKYGEILMKAL